MGTKTQLIIHNTTKIVRLLLELGNLYFMVNTKLSSTEVCGALDGFVHAAEPLKTPMLELFLDFLDGAKSDTALALRARAQVGLGNLYLPNGKTRMISGSPDGRKPDRCTYLSIPTDQGLVYAIVSNVKEKGNTIEFLTDSSSSAEAEQWALFDCNDIPQLQDVVIGISRLEPISACEKMKRSRIGNIRMVLYVGTIDHQKKNMVIEAKSQIFHASIDLDGGLSTPASIEPVSPIVPVSRRVASSELQ